MRFSISTGGSRLTSTLPIPQLMADIAVRQNPSAVRLPPAGSAVTARAATGAGGHGQLPPSRLLLQDQAGEEDGEEGLGLDDDRRQAGRHSVGEAEELEEELPGEQGQADGA